jgi:hypothetical protein
MDRAFEEPLCRLILRSIVLRRSAQEVLVRKLRKPQVRALEVKKKFEPSHVAAECLAQAYERLVPILRRPVARGIQVLLACKRCSATH